MNNAHTFCIAESVLGADGHVRQKEFHPVMSERNELTGGIELPGVLREEELSAAAPPYRRDFRGPASYAADVQIGSMGGIVTYQLLQEVEGDFDAVDVVFHGFSANTNQLRASLAVSESLSSTKYPVVGGSAVTSAAPWVDLTVNGSTAIVVPAKLGPFAQSSIKCDTAFKTSVLRTDLPASNKRIIMLRIVTPSTPDLTTGRVDNTIMSAIHSALGFSQAGHYWYGDGIASYPAFSAAVDSGTNRMPAFSLRLHQRGQPGKSLMFAGDSTYAQVGSAAPFSPFGYRVASLAKASGKNLIPSHLGWAGAPSSTALQRFMSLASVTKPDISLYQPYSVNDVSPSAQSAMINAVTFRNYCIDNKILPIISTPNPNGAVGAAMGATELAIRAALLDLPYCLKLDNSSLLGDANFGWQAEYRYDANHQNDAGRDVQAQALFDLIFPIL